MPARRTFTVHRINAETGVEITWTESQEREARRHIFNTAFYNNGASKQEARDLANAAVLGEVCAIEGYTFRIEVNA